MPSVPHRLAPCHPVLSTPVMPMGDGRNAFRLLAESCGIQRRRKPYKQELDQPAFLLQRKMALTQKLQIRQSQALVMTPQLMQAIKLLQLSNLDLVAYVDAELERNPLLERPAEDQPVDERDGSRPRRARPRA